MEHFASVIVRFMCLMIGIPMILAGAFHLLLPKAAWSVYRAWGKFWNSDPEKMAPEYKWAASMRVVGIALGLGGAIICFIPKFLGL